MIQLKIKEHDALIGLIILSIFIAVLVIVILSNASKSLTSRIQATKNQYVKAEKLYKKMEINKSRKKQFNENLLVFVQRIENIDDIKRKVLSVSSSETSGSVIIKLANLNLDELVKLLKFIDSYSNIKVQQFILKKNFSNKNLVDISITIGKTI